MKAIKILMAVLALSACSQPQYAAKVDVSPKIDTASLKLDLALRRVGTIIKMQDFEIAYFTAANQYYQTHEEKYRLEANRLHGEYGKSFALYKMQDDSLNGLYGVIDTASFLSNNGQIPESNRKDGDDD